jgi:hypothetical protein
MAERTIVQARESFAVYLTDGRPFSVVTGDTFYSDDPVVKGREQLFGELTVRTSQGPSHKPPPAPARAAETADAAPVQRRTVTRPADKADRKGEV